jgi:hypothetical protein
MCYNRGILRNKGNKMTKADLLKMVDELNEMARLLANAMDEGVGDDMELALDDAIFKLESVADTVVDIAQTV